MKPSIVSGEQLLLHELITHSQQLQHYIKSYCIKAVPKILLKQILREFLEAGFKEENEEKEEGVVTLGPKA